MFCRTSARSSLLVVLATAVILLPGCGGSKAATSGDASSAGPTTTTFAIPKDELVSEVGKATVTISAVDNTMEPQYVEITAGTKVVFKNDGRNAHDLVPAVDGAFEGVPQATFVPGASHIVTFDTPGDFPYFCSVHGTMKHGMNGAIRVVAATS